MMTVSTREILERLERVQKSGDGWIACCPAHDDRSPSLSISEGTNGKLLLHCHAGCSFEEIIAALDLPKNGRAPADLTVERLARAKGLPVRLLKRWGVKELKPGLLKITYRDSDSRSDTIRQRLRTDLSAKEGSVWKKGSKPIVPYGLWMLEKMREKAPHLLLEEGESDAWTAWKQGIPALGIPGQSMHRTLELDHVKPFEELYVCIEADEGGRSFASNVKSRLRKIGYKGDVYALRFPDEAPDLNDLYRDDPDAFEERIGRMMEEAPTLDVWISEHEAVKGTAHDSRDGDDSESGESKSAATKTVELAAAQAEFFHHDRDPYARRVSDGHIFRLGSEAFHEWIADLYLSVHGRALPSSSFTDALAALKGRARKTEHAVHVRTTGSLSERRVHLYLGKQRVCRVTPERIEVVGSETCEARFWEPQAAKALPDPDLSGTLDDVGDALDLEGDALLVATGWLMAALLPGGPYPVLAVYGPQGSGKSTRCRQITRLIDPSKLLLRTQPRKEDDLIVAARSSHVLTFDNVSRISDWMSDALCRIATGGGLAKRTLYTDADVTVVNVKRPVIINAIVDVVSRSDLADRLMLLELDRLEGRRTERAVETRFERYRAKALGALMKGVQAALRTWEDIELPELPRMADAAMWAEAGLRGLGAESLAFFDAFNRSAADAQRSIIDSDLVGSLVVTIAERGGFKGTATKLLHRLEEIASGQQGGLPSDAAHLGTELRKLDPALRSGYGVEIEFKRTPQKRLVIIHEKESRDSPSSLSSPSSAGPNDSHDSHDSELKDKESDVEVEWEDI
jgi:energy-coupling factor transporter ATP-binding protein EcfA2